MNNWALKTISVDKIGKEVSAQASQLLTSKSVEDICDTICRGQDLTVEPGQNVINIAGKMGSGRTTFCQAVLQVLMQNQAVKATEFIYIKIDKSDNVNCVWNCGVRLARAKNIGSAATLLASGSSTYETKLNSMVDIFDSFKVVCFDGLCNSEINHQLYTLLMCIIPKLVTNVIYVSKSETPIQSENYGTMLEVHGLNPQVIGKDLKLQKTMQYLKAIYKSMDQSILLNPKATQLLGKTSQITGTLPYEVEEVSSQKGPVQIVFNLIWKQLSDHEKKILCQLSELRRALPLKEASMLTRVIQMDLVEYEAPGQHGNLFGQVMLSDSVQEFVLMKKSEGKILTGDLTFDVLDQWIMLLSSELGGLIEEARKNSWPFVPEKWQYVTNAGEKESYNIKDLITMKAKNLPHLTNFDILQEILHHSVLRKDHENMAAILFLIDRYIYWQGGSKMLLDIVDSIMQEKPELPIAPQLVIRKARLLRTSGDLQGAEKVLDKLLNEKEQLGMWHYSENHHYHLVKAVCVQIKGEIQATLGQWYNSAVLLLDSVHFFKTLPKVDKKGLSSSLGLLVNTLKHISVEEFQLLAQRYVLEASHPYLQAYNFAIEAAGLAIFTPLFYARHKRRAGEMMLEYSELCTDELKPRYVADALKELKMSLAAHKNLDSLKSREQYYEFISALYKTSCVLNLKDDKQRELKICSMILFEHYGSHQTLVVHNVNSLQNINRAARLLELPSFVELDVNDIYTTAFTAPLYHGQAGKSPMAMVDRFAETVQTLSVEGTVDRSKSTVLTMEDYLEDGSVMFSGYGEKGYEMETTYVSECEVSSYDAVRSEWTTQKTLVYIGEQLNLTKDNEGAQRDPFMVEYLGQDEPMGKYVGKRYKRPREVKQYKADVECQMTARYYVGLFNQELYHQRIEVSPIQFLPVVMLTLLNDSSDQTGQIYNVEPYMQGNFTKLTNNWNWVEKDGTGSKLVLAFSHFTYERSKYALLITDHQGWTSDDHRSTTFLTDPQIHSIDKTLYGTGNLGTRGIENFWQVMHEECNEICRQLGLTRPK